MSAKVCRRCGATKPVEEFSRSRMGVRGPVYRSECKPCNTALVRQWQRENVEKTERNSRSQNLKPYGLTLEEYNERLAEQGGVCAICLAPERDSHGRTGRVFSLAVDHDHSTGRIRGLLCQRCNRAIGLLNDDAERIRRAASYLEGSEILG